MEARIWRKQTSGRRGELDLIFFRQMHLGDTVYDAADQETVYRVDMTKASRAGQMKASHQGGKRSNFMLAKVVAFYARRHDCQQQRLGRSNELPKRFPRADLQGPRAALSCRLLRWFVCDRLKRFAGRFQITKMSSEKSRR